MTFTSPMPFKEALDAHEVRSVLPTSGNTADMAQLDAAAKERAMWSATVTSGELLQKVDDMAGGVLSGDIDEGTARAQIKDLLDDMGYVPDPNDAGGLQDLSSDQRINLQLETNIDTARGYGWWAQGQQQDVLDEYPADELIRFRVPKGGEAAERDWLSRWQEAGGQFYDGRMIAPKNDPVWNALGDPGIFPDGLGNPYAPFAFNSGEGTRDVDRDEAEDLGVVTQKTKLSPQSRGFNDDLKASPDVRSAGLRSLMEASGLGSFDSDGVFNFTGKN